VERADPDNIGAFLVSARSFEEYVAMFSLTPADLQGRVLDCPGGGSSFTARARNLGGDPIAVDPVYAMPAADLADLALRETERGSLHTAEAERRYRWAFFRDVAEHRRVRRLSATVFGHDVANSPGSYVAAGLPTLPFEDASFDLVLSSHFLFMYADRLDLTFHVRAMLELVRVCRAEVRVFPLVDQVGARHPELLDAIRDALEPRGFVVDVIRVGYEFQRGGDEMLVVRRSEGESPAAAI
jgi:hypothetical protein